jgi:hypothetical protein
MQRIIAGSVRAADGETCMSVYRAGQSSHLV